jgi:hypothetical protein
MEFDELWASSRGVLKQRRNNVLRDVARVPQLSLNEPHGSPFSPPLSATSHQVSSTAGDEPADHDSHEPEDRLFHRDPEPSPDLRSAPYACTRHSAALGGGVSLLL